MSLRECAPLRDSPGAPCLSGLLTRQQPGTGLAWLEVSRAQVMAQAQPQPVTCVSFMREIVG